MLKRVAKWAAIALAGLALLAAALLFGLDTQPGRRFVADRLAEFTLASGLNFRAGRIDGSIYGRMTLRQVEVRDTQGVFLTIPTLTVDWRPFRYLNSAIDVRLFDADEMLLSRSPVLNEVPSDPNAPLLPDLDISIDRLRVGRLVIAPAVTGRRHIVGLAGSAEIADGRAQIRLDADAQRSAGVAGGDRLKLLLDAVPDANRFALDARLAAPRGGLVDSYAGLGKPLQFAVAGRGDWADWRGRATGTLGGQPLAALDLTGRDGSFRAVGQVRPALMLTGPAARLTEPAIRIDATAALAERRADTRIALRSDAFALDAVGLLDLGRSQFGGFKVQGQLLKPSVLAPNLAASNLRFQAALDGPFGTPVIEYRLAADAIGIDAMRVEALAANGRAVIDTDRILVPVHATARRVTGLNAAAGSLLTNIRIDGDLAYQDGKLASDSLRIRSDRVDATAIVLADITKGTYTGALKGRVNDYQVDGLGRINLVTDARLVPGAQGGFAIRGRVRVTTSRLDNASVRDQLGGNAVITADVGYDLAGGATVSNLRLTAPKLRITSGRGFYRPDGRLEFHATGSSTAYGPLQVEVSGTVANPIARLRAARPGLGVGLAGIDATVVGTGAGYRVRVTGQSDYGPLAADVTLNSAAGTFDIAGATFAGIRFAGRVAQTKAGPFAGTLTVAGQGLNGSVRLAAAGSVQRADLDLRASGAKLPGPAPITIGSGTIRATVLLPASGPTVTGAFALADLRSGTLAVRTARGRINYAGGAGRVAFTAAGGQAGAPFDIAAQAQLSPSRIVANLRGTLNGIAVRLARPAVATSTPAGWQLAPTTVVLPQGQVDVSGTFGSQTRLHAQLRTLDLSIANAFVPGFGLGGKATGSVDYAASGAVPDVRARLDIAGFTRTASLTVSAPVDIALLATLNDAGGDARALVRRGGATVGRIQARLAPLGAGASLTDRLLAAPLSGGIRYNGPAEVLWALTGIGRQQVSGPIAIGADFGGRLDRPQLNGVIRANALRYENETYGTVLSKLAIDGRFTQSELQLNSLTATAGGGTVSARGRIGLDAASGFPIDVTATLANARLARGDDISATASGTIAITNSRAAGGLIRGELTIPEARYRIIRSGGAAVRELSGVRRKGAVPVAADAPTQGSLPSNWKLDIRIRADNQIFVEGMGLEAEWRTDMRVTGTSTTPSVVGRLEVVRGTYSFAGRRFEIDRGRITFQGGLTNPALDIAASTTVEDVSAGIAISGTAQKPQIAFTSTPALPQDEVLSRLLFGSSVTSLSPTQAIQLAAALNSLRGSGGGLDPLGKLRGVAGLDRLRVLGADDSAGRGTSLAAGKYITNNVYVEIVTDARGFTATQLEIALSRALSVLSQTGSFGGSNVSLRYRKTY